MAGKIVLVFIAALSAHLVHASQDDNIIAPNGPTDQNNNDGETAQFGRPGFGFPGPFPFPRPFPPVFFPRPFPPPFFPPPIVVFPVPRPPPVVVIPRPPIIVIPPPPFFPFGDKDKPADGQPAAGPEGGETKVDEVDHAAEYNAYLQSLGYDTSAYAAVRA